MSYPCFVLCDNPMFKIISTFKTSFASEVCGNPSHKNNMPRNRRGYKKQIVCFSVAITNHDFHYNHGGSFDSDNMLNSVQLHTRVCNIHIICRNAGPHCCHRLWRRSWDHWSYFECTGKQNPSNHNEGIWNGSRLGLWTSSKVSTYIYFGEVANLLNY